MEVAYFGVRGNVCDLYETFGPFRSLDRARSARGPLCRAIGHGQHGAVGIAGRTARCRHAARPDRLPRHPVFAVGVEIPVGAAGRPVLHRARLDPRLPGGHCRLRSRRGRLSAANRSDAAFGGAAGHGDAGRHPGRRNGFACRQGHQRANARRGERRIDRRRLCRLPDRRRLVAGGLQCRRLGRVHGGDGRFHRRAQPAGLLLRRSGGPAQQE